MVLLSPLPEAFAMNIARGGKLFTALDRALCKVGLHRWKMYGPWREGDQRRAMWARCAACPRSRYLTPYGGKYPLLIFGRGVSRGR